MMPTEERVKILRDAPPQTWIAFSEDESRLVATGATYDEVVQKAEDAGVTDPVLVMTPASWIPVVLV